MKFKLWEHRGLLGERESNRRATPNPAPGGSGDYTADVLNYLSATASGHALRGTAAAIEICAGVWQRGMATAEVSPQNGRTASLTPTLLGYVGRYLLLRGEVLFEIGVRDGQITLTPAQSWTVQGGVDPASWVYECTFQGPSGSVVRTLPRSRVLHLQYSQSHHAPWVGVGPLSSAGLTQELVAQIETALAQEASTPRGYNFAVPDVKQAGKLTTELRSSKGALNLTPSVASDAAWGAGMESKPADDWVSKRFGMMPPLPMVELRSRVELSVLAACGVPVTILSTSDGTAKAKDFSRFLTLTMVPLGKIIAGQISDALDVPGLAFDFNDLGAADIASKGRVFGQLVSNGVSIADAAEVAGLPISDTTPSPAPRASSDT